MVLSLSWFGLRRKRRRRRVKRRKKKGKRKKVGFAIIRKRIRMVYKTPGKRKRHFSNGRAVPKGKRVYRLKSDAKLAVMRMRRRKKRRKKRRKSRTYRTKRRWSTKSKTKVSASARAAARRLSPTMRQKLNITAAGGQRSCALHQPPCPRGCERGGGNTCRAARGRAGRGQLTYGRRRRSRFGLGFGGLYF